MNFTEEMLGSEFHLPEIKIFSDGIPLTTDKKRLHFKIKAIDSKYKLDRLNVYVNDVPIYDAKGINLRDRDVKEYEGFVDLDLSNGNNKIQVSCHNQKGVESRKEIFTILYNGPTTKPDLYIFAIGVSQYKDSRYDLDFAAKDARDIANFLSGNLSDSVKHSSEFEKKSPLPKLDINKLLLPYSDWQKNISELQKSMDKLSKMISDVRFKRTHIFKILNSNATRENILAINDTLMNSKVDDEVIIFMAGHGLLDKELNYFFATTDIDFSNPTARGLPYEEIENLFDGIPARKKLLLMDTCHSGEVDKEDTQLDTVSQGGSKNIKIRSFRNVIPIPKSSKLGLSNSFQLMQELFANLSRGSGAVVISASAGVEFALEDEKWQNGVFTYSLLEGLKTKNADLNGDGEIRVSELKEHVTKKVQELTNGRQTPTSRQENLEFDFRIF